MVKEADRMTHGPAVQTKRAHQQDQNGPSKDPPGEGVRRAKPGGKDPGSGSDLGRTIRHK